MTMRDAWAAYERDVARFPVWSPAEEREAGARLVAARESGNAFAERREINRFVNHNQRLVLSVALRFRTGPLPLLDLVQEGNLGLIHGAEKFDPSRGYRFSTYATWWIRQAITRALNNDGATIRVPVHMAETVAKVRRARARFLAATGREPSERDLAAMARKPVGKVRAVDALPGRPASLDAPIGEDGPTWLDATASSVASPLDAALANERASVARRLLSTLDPREREVLGRRLGDGEETPADIGEDWGLSRERIRQIQTGALDRLRATAARDSARARTRRSAGG